VAITEVFTGIAVADFDAARAWYERLLGRPPDLVPNENEAAWQLAEAGWIYVVRDRDRAGKALLTLLVDDLEGHVAELAERGIATEPIETVPGVVKKAEITDREGNRITIGEPQRR
jgi:catechol 2,3-dioxygenase-like lactoylglutathione lyase family enzyme